MKKWYAKIKNLDTDHEFEIGEYSEKALRDTLREINDYEVENLDRCAVDIYTVEE